MGSWHGGRGLAARYLSVALAAILGSLPLVGCRGSQQAAAPSPYNRPPGGPPPRRGLTTGQKVAILAGAAALYYLYNKHKNAQGEGQAGRYYRSKNGRIYYRDAQGQAHWVTPPPGGIQVPADVAQQYSGYQGYNNQPSGQSFGGYGAASGGASGGPPGPPGPPGR
jgi:hypothetical protein